MRKHRAQTVTRFENTLDENNVDTLDEQSPHEKIVVE